MSHPYAFNTTHWPGLAKVGEEMNELGIELNKLLMVGGDTDAYWGKRPLRQNIVEETADVLASARYFAQQNFTAEELKFLEWRIAIKTSNYHEWAETE